MTDSTILEFMSKHCKQDKRHDCAGMIGLDFEVVVRRRSTANSMTHNTLHIKKDRPINKFSASINNDYEVNSCG
jgi:hypothetical protein